MRNTAKTTSTASPNGAIADGLCNRSPLSITSAHHGSSKTAFENHSTQFNLHNSFLHHRDRDACGFLLVS
jgi:hypothetical protein